MTRKEPSVLTVIWCCGSESYFSAAAGAVEDLVAKTDTDIVVVTPEPHRLPVVTVPRVTVYPLSLGMKQRRADPFVAKFAAIKAALSLTDHEVVLMMDADCRVGRPWTSHDVREALGQADFAVAEQSITRGTGMGRKSFLDHYASVSLPGVLPNGPVPSEGDFRYYNSGVVIGRRAAWERLIDFAETVTGPDRPLEVSGCMVADQDIIQVWLNSVGSASVTELSPEIWNACSLWCDVSRNRSKILHFSNFCQGPTDELLGYATVRDGVEVVIVTHQSQHCIGEAIASLENIGINSITVVDNASSDGTQGIVMNTRARLIRNDVNLGFGMAANVGILHSEHEYVMVMNPDVSIDSSTIRSILHELQRDPLALVGPTQLIPGRGQIGMQPVMTRTHLLRSVIENSRRSHSLLSRMLSRVDRRVHSAERGWILGSCLAATRQAWQSIQGFDASYFMYMEDVDLSERWLERGWAVVVIPQVVTHNMGNGSRIPADVRVRHLNHARIEYGRRRYGTFFARILTWVAR